MKANNNLKKSSSPTWVRRQLTNVYVKMAKKEGYRARSAYKLIDLQEKFSLYNNNSIVLDLGCAPGGWSQVLIPKVKTVVGIDLSNVEPMTGLIFLQGDFVEEKERLYKELPAFKFDLVLCDAAPNSCGHHFTDTIKSSQLVDGALEFALPILRQGGTFASKILIGGHEKDLIAKIKKHFGQVKQFKPPASRKDSCETYIVARNFSLESSCTRARAIPKILVTEES